VEDLVIILLEMKVNLEELEALTLVIMEYLEVLYQVLSLNFIIQEDVILEGQEEQSVLL
jgi:hypothetical protein